MLPPSTIPLRHKLSSNNLHDPPTPNTPHGFRAQINQLIPKHSYFRARVAIHQIDSVPFVSGLFSVRWRFKHVHSPPTQRQGLLGMVKTRSKNGDKRLPHHHSGDDPDSNNNPPTPSDTSLPSLLISSDSSSTTTATSARVPSFASTSTSSSSTSSGAISALAGAVYSITARSTQSETLTYSNYASASRSTLHLPSSASPTPTTTTFPSLADASPSFTPARGNTPYLDLKDHSVHWNQTLSTVVRLDIDRDTGSILPCPFKLVVMQRVREHDPETHRLGALYLNLSEYVGHGPVERRYLLRESKTNATLKLTIELEYISGETHYIPPPLPKGEILNGLSGYLEGELRTVTRGQTVDIYGPYRDQDELEIDLFGTQYHSTTTTSTTKTTTRRIRYPVDDDDSDVDHISVEDDDHKSLNITGAEHEASPLPSPQPQPETAAFDVERLPIAYGTKTTESLIEAIFNPVKTSERRCESPFTIYVPPPTPASLPSLAQVTKSGVGGEGGDAPRGASTRVTTTATSEVESVYSTESSSASSGSGSGSSGGSGAASTRAMSQSGRSTRDSQSQYSHHSSSDTRSLRSTNGASGGGGGGAGGRVKDWWRKIGSSRPHTPVGR